MTDRVPAQIQAPTNKRVIGISDFLVSKDPRDELITYSLGSCLGVTLYDPERKIGGLIHCLLPVAKGSTRADPNKPAMFVDTGMVALLNAILRMGARKEKMIVKVAGCASPLQSCSHFRIGERNYTVLRRVLWKNELMIAGQDTGGTEPRTMSLDIATGITRLKIGHATKDL